MTNQEIRAEPIRAEERVPLLLDSKEVADILRIAVKTVNKLVRQGKLACVQVTSSERRFTHEQVQEYIKSQSTNPRVDKKEPRPVSSYRKKGGDRAKSSGVTRAELRKELSSWR